MGVFGGRFGGRFDLVDGGGGPAPRVLFDLAHNRYQAQASIGLARSHASKYQYGISLSRQARIQRIGRSRLAKKQVEKIRIGAALKHRTQTIVTQSAKLQSHSLRKVSGQISLSRRVGTLKSGKSSLKRKRRDRISNRGEIDDSELLVLADE